MRRLLLIALPLVLCATPVLAEQQQRKDEPSLEEDIKIPPDMSDPQLSGRLVDTLQALSKAFLSLPAGEVEAALEGRKVTQADRARTVASETGMTERELRRKLDESRPAMANAQKALVEALPAMMKAMTQAGKELERATANMPRPDYPRR